MKTRFAWAIGLAMAMSSIIPTLALGEEDIFAQYREMFGDDNPAELMELQGEELWKTPGGPKKTSLEQCDLGLGAGKVAGAYAQLPRYFEDADRVQDLETRLAWCMVEKQGLSWDEATANPFSVQGQSTTNMEALAAWIAGQSKGVAVAVPQEHPKEIAAFKTGEKLFNYRAGPYDFSCATCHSQSGKRIRLQSLPNLAEAAGAREAYIGWPAYRVSQGAVRTMQWRVGDCARQQRLPKLKFTSDASIALISYMGVKAAGEPMDAPGLKR